MQTTTPRDDRPRHPVIFGSVAADPLTTRRDPYGKHPRIPFQVTADAIGYTYKLPKSKCLKKSTDRGLQCDKDHEHQRGIVAEHRDPMQRETQLCARALRLCKKLSGEPAFTLWNQSRIAAEVRVRVAKVVFVRVGDGDVDGV